jgi:hypothetical protein
VFEGDVVCSRTHPISRSLEPGARSQEPGARSQEPGAGACILGFGVLLQWQQRAGEDEDQEHEVVLRLQAHESIGRSHGWRRSATSRPGLPKDVAKYRCG